MADIERKDFLTRFVPKVLELHRAGKLTTEHATSMIVMSALDRIDEATLQEHLRSFDRNAGI